jgi:hypothetical protein
MKYYLRSIAVLLMVLLFTSVVPCRATALHFEARTGYFPFVVIETTVTRQGIKTSSANPEERRFYVSDVIEFPDNPQLYRKADELVDEYFVKTVVEPMKAKGILLTYYMQDVKIDNGAVYTPATKAEAEELRKKTLEELKEMSANVFTFTWQYGKQSKGLETASPKLFFHDPEKPLYGESKSTEK